MEKTEKFLVEKWSGLIESKKAAPVANDQKNSIAKLLENQENYSKGLLESGSSVQDISYFTPILVPAVRRIYPTLVANEIVGVQAMTQPTGYAFALRYIYGDGKTPYLDRGANSRNPNDGSKLLAYNAASGNSAIVVLSDPTITVGLSAVHINSASGTTVGTVVYAEPGKFLVNLVAGQYISTGSVYVNGTSGALTVSFSLPNAEAVYRVMFQNYAYIVDKARGETMGDPNGSDPMRSMKLSLEKASVEAMTRKLKAEYSIELVQDLKNMHGIDAEYELLTLLENEIAMEIDRELVNRLKTEATVTTTWAYSTAGVTGAQYSDGRWEFEKFRNLYTKIIHEATQIGLTSRRGMGNFVICSTQVLTALRSLNNFVYGGLGNTGKTGTIEPSLGVAKVGTLDGTINVYIDTFANEEYCLVGYKGSTPFDTGVVYCPYIPLLPLRAVDPNTFQPKIAFMTRDAIAANLYGAENYYRKFTVDFTGSTIANAHTA